MTSRKLTVGLLSVLAATGILASEPAQPKADWLVGSWVICEDPDNSPKDSLQFNADGTGLVIRTKGNVEFLHRHTGHSVSLLANVNGYAIPIEMSASTGFDRLLLHSDRTGNISSYVRSDSPQSGKCSIK